MENLIVPCSSKAPIAAKPSEFSPIPTKSTIPFSKESSSKYPDVHLNYLCKNGRLSEAITALDSIAQRGSTAYAISGKSDDAYASKLRKLEKENGRNRFVGQCWIAVKNRVYSFDAGKTMGNLILVLSTLSVVTTQIQTQTQAPSPLLTTIPKMDKLLSQTFHDSAKKPVTVGPWGGDDGVAWDDGIHSSVKQVVITYGTAIDSIQFEYDDNGNSIWSEKHGGRGGYITDKVNLDCPNEFLTSIQGYYGRIIAWGPVLLRSLTFKSNKKTYGPFGNDEGTSFSHTMNGGKIVGFHGRSGWYVDSIGVHLLPRQQQNSSRPLVHTQSRCISTGTDNVGFSVIQGNIGQSYDIILAVKQREDVSSKPLSLKSNKNIKLSKQFSNDSDQDSSNSSSSDEETKEKKRATTKTPAAQKMPTVSKVPSMVDGVVTYGPWGGSGGYAFDDGTYTGIKQINVSRNIGIVYVKVFYDKNGEAVPAIRHGGTGGFKNDKIIFDYPNEILTHITGSYGPAMYMGPNVIKSLTFHTNIRTVGPFGDEQGNSFSSKLKEGKIVGFHGKSGLFLDAIGVHVIEGKVPVPVRNPTSSAIVPVGNPPSNAIFPVANHPSNAIVPMSNPPSKAIVPLGKQPAISEIDHPQWPNKLVLAKRGPVEEVACGVVKEPAPCGPGPWGGDGGRPWDDGVFTGIKQIYLTRGPEAIHSIQIEYDRNGQSVWSVKHGGSGGNIMHRVKLEFPHEVLICISGYYGSIDRDERPKVIKSLTFYTSRGKYGPFGEEVGTFFTSTTTEGKAVGFHGRSSLYLDAIGIHMQHWLGNQKTTKSSLFRRF
ncbi:hypothetical protein FEM48_Zijuj06G0087700 [Ziziphus jujuba var. spinosa]|uniref:Jacalin-type lectin domain-containing protein n=1 Tax=Ziziphus jujuba var. spinosa TaxID=714518 RepID=A0A978V8A6_ZIZJJ|nr:hypothetical protein FEM48_Zijuj06G0087700 [Ziziphus jujuba var. spinosa]